MNNLSLLTPRLALLRSASLVVGLAGAAGCAAGYLSTPHEFFPGYLVGWLFWLGITLGCLVFLMIHAQTGGAWGVVLSPVLEAANDTLLLVAVLALPLVFGISELYDWADPDKVALDNKLLEKTTYLNVDGYLMRGGSYLAFWLLSAAAMSRWSANDEPKSGSSLQRRRAAVSGPGLIVYGLTITLASIDWVMSIEPHWSSTMYGTIYMAAQAASGLAFAILVTALVASQAPWVRVAHPSRFRDLGNLLLTAISFWAYVVFMQFLLIWSANLPEEVTFYISRSRGGWQTAAVVLSLLCLFVPLPALLSRDLKRRRRALAAVAALVLIGSLGQWYWLVVPHFGEFGTSLWQSLAAVAAIGGFWVALFASRLSTRARWPVGETLLEGDRDERPRYEAA